MYRKLNISQGDQTIIIIVEYRQKTVGMTVGSVSDIVSFTPDNIVDEEFASDIQSKYLSGLARSDKKIILLLDPGTILSFDHEEYSEQHLESQVS